MNIFEFAMKMEKDGEQYYLELAQKSAGAGFKNVFTMLAKAESVHYEIIRKMRDNEKTEVQDSKLLSEVRNIFEQMKDKGEKMEGLEKLTDLYAKARDIENNSINFYLRQADTAIDQHQKDIFTRVAGEEKRHFFIMEEIINFVSKPDSWLENPEWHHLEEY